MWFDTMKTVSKKWNSNETRTLVKEMKESEKLPIRLHLDSYR